MITGRDLRVERERAGATHAQLAALIGVGAHELEEWESSGNVPRKHRYPLKLALWELERDVALEQSGLAECPWMGALPDIGGTSGAEGVIEHMQGCAVCQARLEFVRANVSPRPIGGSLPDRVAGVLDRLHGWQRSAFAGAISLLAMGGIGVLLMLANGILRREPAFIAGAIGLCALLVISGGVAGIAHHLTTSLRSGGSLGYYSSWILTAFAYLASAIGLLALGGVLVGSEHLDESVRRLSEPSGWWVVLLTAAIFGMLVGWSARRRGRATGSSRRERTVLALAGVVIIVAAILPIGVRLLMRSAGPMTVEEWEAALPALRAAVEQDPEDARAQQDLAWALVNLDLWDEALPILEQATALNPHDADLHNSLGWAYMRERRYENALAPLEWAVEKAPTHTVAHHNLGWALYNLGRYAEAEQAYRVAIRLAPEVPNTHSELGWVLIALHRLDEAESAFREAIRLEPTKAGHHRGLGVALMQNGRPAEGLAAYDAVIALVADDAGVWSELGYVAHLAGDHERAMAAFERAIELHPTLFADSEAYRELWEAAREGSLAVPATPR